MSAELRARLKVGEPTDAVAWRRVEQAVGREVPEVVKAFAASVPAGTIGDYVVVPQPTGREWLPLLPTMLGRVGGDLFPFAGSLDGDAFYVGADGVTVWDSATGETSEFPLKPAEFLLAWMDGAIDPLGWGEALSSTFRA